MRTVGSIAHSRGLHLTHDGTIVIKRADEVAVYIRGGWVKLVPDYDAFVQSPGQVPTDNYRAVSVRNILLAAMVLTIILFQRLVFEPTAS